MNVGKGPALFFNKNFFKRKKQHVVEDNLDIIRQIGIDNNWFVIAAGEYDGYVAEPRACEWDIAAGHAILKHAGGVVTDFENKEIKYGKKDFKNPSA